jgi:hypothetical protein
MYYNPFISWRPARRFFVGQVGRGTLWVRPIGNRPAGSAYNTTSDVTLVCGLPMWGRFANLRPISKSAFR